MRTAGEILNELVRELFEDGAGVLTVDLVERRQREFAAAASAARAGSAHAEIAATIARHLGKTAQVVRAEAFRL